MGGRGGDEACCVSKLLLKLEYGGRGGRIGRSGGSEGDKEVEDLAGE